MNCSLEKKLTALAPELNINESKLVSFSSALPSTRTTSATPPVTCIDLTSENTFPGVVVILNKYNLYLQPGVPGVPDSYMSDLTLAVPIIEPGDVGSPPKLSVLSVAAVSLRLTVDPVEKSKLPRW